MENKSEEDKMIESILSIMGIFTEELKDKDVELVQEKMIEDLKEGIALEEKQNGEWIDIHNKVSNSMQKALIKNLIDKSFISIKNLHETLEEVEKDYEEMKKFM